MGKINFDDDYIFSLDIGTRNVIGLIGKIKDDKFKIIDYHCCEHPQRAMYDGQIHDIPKVAKIVRKIVDVLEERNDINLNKVAIAAAGRALKTKAIEIQREIDPSKNIEKKLLNNIEMEGIQKAQDELDKELDLDTRYYCVGYSVKEYYLDNKLIKNPIEHQGKNLKVDLIATFLPHIVVDSLYTVIDKSNLEVINLTLEPIAAIDIALKENLRMLNLALVDIGAGTSDIAITKSGTITSYGMVSKAGDVITEQLVQKYLLDFDEAEKLKKGLSNKEKVEFEDIVGIKHSYDTDKILEVLEETIDEITEAISKKIIETNGKSPSAVFLIGGGSKIPLLTEKLAKKLDLPNERVTIKQVDSIESIDFSENKLTGPEYITPVGIGYIGIREREKDFLQVSVNGKNIRLFNSKKLSVSHALILVGYSARKLLSSRGKDLYFTINGKKEFIKGKLGKPADIYVNGSLATLETKIKNKDNIYIDQANRGKDAKITIGEYIDYNKIIYFENKEIPLIKSVKVNGQNINKDYLIKQGDNIIVEQIETLKELCNFLNIDYEKYYFTCDDEKIEKDYVLKNNDKIKKNEINKNEINKNKDKSPEKIKPETNKKEKEYQYFIVNGDPVKVQKEEKMIFVDIFEYIDFDLKTSKGILDLKLNGNRAKYTDKLKDGDKIYIGWR
ncbi:MAG: cell division protein FtsA [Bacillota bacterium]